jgi:hypothetical protein
MLIGALVCAAASPLACRSSDLSNSDEAQRFEIVAVSPEEQEAAAMQLTVCEERSIDTSEWSDLTFLPYYRVLLPRDYVVEDHTPGEQQLWVAPDGSLFLMTQHQGDGRTMTMIGFDEPGTTSDEVACRLEVVGRTAELSQFVLHLRGQTRYSASLDVGVRDGLGLGVAILAASAARRAELIAAIETISIVSRD